MTISTTGRDAGRSGGFTLLELILVMLIVAVVMAMAAPSLGLFTGARPLTDTAALIVALADHARTQAVTEGRLYRLNIDAESGRVWVTAQEGAEFAPLRTDFGREFRLPEGTRLAWPTPPAPRTDTTTTVPGLLMPGQEADAQQDPQGPSVTVVPFFPDGRSRPCRMRLTDRRGNAVDVECATPAGRFRVVAPEDSGA